MNVGILSLCTQDLGLSMVASAVAAAWRKWKPNAGSILQFLSPDFWTIVATVVGISVSYFAARRRRAFVFGANH